MDLTPTNIEFIETADTSIRNLIKEWEKAVRESSMEPLTIQDIPVDEVELLEHIRNGIMSMNDVSEEQKAKLLEDFDNGKLGLYPEYIGDPEDEFKPELVLTITYDYNDTTVK